VKIFLVVISLFLAGTPFSCLNPFAPKLDTNLQAQLCSDLTSIENVLCTFHNAYLFKDTTLYGALIAPNFVFVYRDYDQGIDVSWGRDVEMRTTYGLFQNVSSLTLTWNNEIGLIDTDTLSSIQRAFNLTVEFNPNDITRVDGNAILTFARANDHDPWKIVRWRDESNY
jgi:hypothetical protein